MKACTFYLLLGFASIGIHEVRAQDLRRNGVQSLEQDAPTPAARALAIERGIEEDLESYDNTSRGLMLKGIALYGDSKNVPSMPPSLNGVSVVDESLLHAGILTHYLRRHIGSDITPRTFEKIRRDIFNYYRKLDHYVALPLVPQNVSNGVLQYLVVVSKLDSVSVQRNGTSYFKDKIYQNPYKKLLNKPLKMNDIGREAEELNRHPFRKASPSIRFDTSEPSQLPAIVDLNVTEKFPISATVGFDNQGNRLLGRTRYYGEILEAGLLGLDELIGYRFTAPYELRKQSSHAVTARIPSPFNPKHEIDLLGFYGRSSIDVPIQSQTFSNTGTSLQATASYSVPFALGATQHQVALGFDYKSSDNNFNFGGQTIAQTSADVYQGWFEHSVSWKGGETDVVKSVKMTNKGVLSPGNLTEKNSDASHNQLRANASSDYAYAHGSVNLVLGANTAIVGKAPDVIKKVVADSFVRVAVEGQVATANLLPSEALSLGGLNSVRGYEENSLQVDQGAIAHVELYGPSVSILGQITKDKEKNTSVLSDGLRPYVFCDYAVGSSKNRLPGEPSSYSLGSVGLGVSYSLNDRLSVNAAYGWQCLERNYQDQLKGRIHFSGSLTW